jgi:hypothetical protein
LHKIKHRVAKVGDLVYPDAAFVRFGNPTDTVIFIAPGPDGDVYGKTRLMAYCSARKKYRLLTLENVVVAEPEPKEATND